MVIPGSLDFGSAHASINWQGQQYKVKIYPRLVHVIKSFNSRFQGEPLMSVAAARKKLRVCDKMLESLTELPAHEIGGFRIEVSITNPTLRGAKAVADSLPFYDLQWWLNPPAGYESYKMDFKVLSPSVLVQNSKWVLQRAENLGMMVSDNSLRVNKVQKEVVADAQASLGWNAGRFRLTKSLSPTAWWTGKESDSTFDYADTASHVVIMNHITKHFGDRSGFRRLINQIRDEGVILCPEGQEEAGHQLKRNGWDPVCMVCILPGCTVSLRGQAVYRWLSQLVIKGTISKTAVGMRLGQAYEAEVEDIIEDAPLSPFAGAPSPTIQQLIDMFGSSKESIKGLFNLIRRLLAPKIGAEYLPCDKNPFDLTHYYIVHKFDKKDHTKFRYRCENKACRDGLSGEAAWAYAARFIDSGEVSRAAVGLPSLENETVEDDASLELPRNTLSNIRHMHASKVTTLPTGPQVPALYKTHWTRGDGNCMFSAIAKAMGGHIGHDQVRTAGINWIRDHPADYIVRIAHNIPEDVYWSELSQLATITDPNRPIMQALEKGYLQVMSEIGVYGDDPILKAVCEAYSLHLVILQQHDDTRATWMQVKCDHGDPEAVIWLNLYELHYENLLVESQMRP